MHTYRFYYQNTDVSITVSLSDAEREYLQTCLDSDRTWFILPEQALNLRLVTMVEAE